MPVAQDTPGDTTTWEADILNGIGAPTSSNNVGKLNAWNRCEGNKAGGSGLPINNPFNTTLNINAGTSVNGAGVKAYPSWAAGLQATVQTLQGGAYKSIVQNLTSDGPFDQFASAVGSSPWGTSGACIASTGGGTSSAGSPGGGAGSSSSGSTGPAGCVITMPVTNSCILSRSNLKALKGGLLLVAGGGMFVAGALVLVAFGLQRSGAARTASNTLRVTGAGKVLKGLGGATGARSKATTGTTGRARPSRSSSSRPAGSSSSSSARVRLRPLPDEEPIEDEADELFEQTRGSARANRRGYRRAMDTDDLRRRTA